MAVKQNSSGVWSFWPILVITVVTSLAVFLAAGRWSDTDVSQETQGGWVEPHLPEPLGPSPVGREEYYRMRLADPRTGKIPENANRRALEFAKRLPKRDSRVSKALGMLEWRQRGPTNVGGRTRAFAQDVRDPNVLLAGAVSGGMWRSTDGGVTWTKTSRPDQTHSVTTLVQDARPGHEDTWYYGTGEGSGNSAGLFGDGIFKSIDGGRSWEQLASTAGRSEFATIWRLAIDGSRMDQDIVYAATGTRLFKTLDGGVTWSVVFGPHHAHEVAVLSNGSVISTRTGDAPDGLVFYSEDGAIWNDITPDMLDGHSVGRIVIAPAPTDERIIYFLGWTPGRGHRGFTESDHSLFRYVHDLAIPLNHRWTELTENMSFTTEISGVQRHLSFAAYWSYNLALTVHPLNPDIVYLGGIGLWRSTSGFADSTHTVDIYGHHADQHLLVFQPDDPKTMFVASDGGVHKADENLQPTPDLNSYPWTSLNDGYVTTQFYTVAVDHDPSFDQRIIGGAQDNGTWITPANAVSTVWAKVSGGDGAYCAFGTEDYIYGSYQKGRVFRMRVSGDDILSNTYSVIDPAEGSDYLFINPFALDPNDRNVMYLAGGSSVWIHRNLGAIPDRSYSQPTTGWEQFQLSAGIVTALGVSVNPPDLAYYSTNESRVFLHETSDPSNQPEEVTRPAPFGWISSIGVDPRDGKRAIVTYSSYSVESVFLTEDGGQSWESISGNLEEVPGGGGAGPSINWIEIVPVGESKTVYLLGATTGLYLTEELNGSQTEWLQEGYDVIGNVVVDMIDVRLSDGFVAVGTHGAGIYSAQIDVDNQSLPAHAEACFDNTGQWTMTAGETFEEAFPGAWDITREGGVDAVWGTVTKRAARGAQSVWPAAFGEQAGSPSGLYRDNMDTWLKLGPFDLQNTSDARFKFDRWIDTQTGDTLRWGASSDGVNFWMVELSGSDGEWKRDGFSMARPETQNMVGQSEVWIAFRFTSDGSGTSEGPFIDNVCVETLADNVALSESPALSTPADSSEGEQLQPALVWWHVSGATQYRLQVARDSLFADGVIDVEVSTTRYDVAEGTLEHGARYWWRVRGANTASTSPWSTVWSFRTEGLPAAVNLVAPVEGNDQVSAYAQLMWNAVPGAERYHLQIDEDARFLSPIIDDSTLTATSDTTETPLAYSTTYFWRVRARNHLGFGPWSEIRAFTVVVGTAVETESALPTSFVLYQNYPNPFNPSTTIRYDVAEASDVRLTLFDASGRLVVELGAWHRTPGTYVAKWDAGGMPSGTYFYRLEAGEVVLTGSMSLTK